MPELTPWPLWNQLNDWTVDADQIDENANNNCGPQSVAMCLKYLTGVELPADFIKDATLGVEKTGYTFTSHLTEFLQRRCNIPCQVHSGDGRTLLQPVVRQAIDNGTPVIVLYFWDINLPDSGHWAPVVRYDNDGCSRANPWGGVMEYWAWPEFERWQKLGHCIVLKRKRDPFLDTRSGTPDAMTQSLKDLQQEALPYIEATLARGTRSVEEILEE